MHKLVGIIFLVSLVITLTFPFVNQAQAALVFSDTFSGDLSSWSDISGSWMKNRLIYVPVWTAKVKADSYYKGYKTVQVPVQKTRTVRDSDGNTRTETYTERALRFPVTAARTVIDGNRVIRPVRCDYIVEAIIIRITYEDGNGPLSYIQRTFRFPVAAARPVVDRNFVITTVCGDYIVETVVVCITYEYRPRVGSYT